MSAVEVPVVLPQLVAAEQLFFSSSSVAVSVFLSCILLLRPLLLPCLQKREIARKTRTFLLPLSKRANTKDFEEASAVEKGRGNKEATTKTTAATLTQTNHFKYG